MSADTISTPTWMLSIPPALAAEITGNATRDALKTFRAFFRNNINYNATPGIDWFETHLHKERDNPNLRFSFTELISHLASTVIAQSWKADLTRGSPSLAQDLQSLVVQYIFGDLTPHTRGCAVLLSLVVGDASDAEVWQAVFKLCNTSLQSPATSPAFGICTKTKQTTVKISDSSVSQSAAYTTIDRLNQSLLDGLVFPNTPKFFETYFLVHPATTAVVVLQKCLKLHSPVKNTWQGWSSASNESQVSSWFCSLSNDFLVSANLPRRYYSSASHSTHKPNIIYLTTPTPITDAPPFNWRNVLVICEFERNHTADVSTPTIVRLASHVREVFCAQKNRRFVHAFTLCGEYIRCWVFHRGGAFGSTEFSINADPKRFLDVVVGYAAMSDIQLGFDTTLTFGEPMAMPGCTERFIVESEPFFWGSKVIVSRATACREAVGVDTKKSYVLKDSWREYALENEGLLLAKTRELGVVGVVELMAYEDVVIEGVLDDVVGGIMRGLQVGNSLKLCSRGESTQIYPSGSKVSNPSPNITFNYIHTRLLLVKGRPLTKSTSPLEFLCAINGAIKGHRSLFVHGILHRDISPNNIMITTSERADRLPGFLIDLDLAIPLPLSSDAPRRIGTVEFMAIGALEGELHTYRHDLESFFYVFLWICSNYTLIDGICSCKSNKKPLFGGWDRSNTWDVAAACKFRNMSKGKSGFDKVLNEFEPWANGLKECAKEWREVLFPLRIDGMWTGTDVDAARVYNEILAVLEQGAQDVCEV